MGEETSDCRWEKRDIRLRRDLGSDPYEEQIYGFLENVGEMRDEVDFLEGLVDLQRH